MPMGSHAPRLLDPTGAPRGVQGAAAEIPRDRRGGHPARRQEQAGYHPERLH